MKDDIRKLLRTAEREGWPDSFTKVVLAQYLVEAGSLSRGSGR
jgi:hypothetical protein